MKTKLLLSIIILWSTGFTTAQSNVKELLISFEFMEGCELRPDACSPISIHRANAEENWVLIFPSGGTQSDVFIYDWEGFNESMGGNLLKSGPLRHDQCGREGVPKLELKSLPDGKYYVRMLACGLGVI